MQTVRLIGYGSSLGERLTGYENLYSSQPYFYATLSFLHHFVAIGELKLELQSGNAIFESNSMIF